MRVEKKRVQARYKNDSQKTPTQSGLVESSQCQFTVSFMSYQCNITDQVCKRGRNCSSSSRQQRASTQYRMPVKTSQLLQSVRWSSRRTFACLCGRGSEEVAWWDLHTARQMVHFIWQMICGFCLFKLVGMCDKQEEELGSSICGPGKGSPVAFRVLGTTSDISKKKKISVIS